MSGMVYNPFQCHDRPSQGSRLPLTRLAEAPVPQRPVQRLIAPGVEEQELMEDLSDVLRWSGRWGRWRWGGRCKKPALVEAAAI